MTTHEEQQRFWDEEHKNPHLLLQMDSEEASGGVVRFWEYLGKLGMPRKRGVEMGCGKGRNTIWLSSEGADVEGFDFSGAAILEAVRRAEIAGAAGAHFMVQDATKPWAYESDSFDFGIDCFALTDIESAEGRTAAVAEFHRVLRPGGYLLAYLLSTEDEFHKEMIEKAPGDEKNSFTHPSGKYEKVFDEQELAELYKDFELVEAARVDKTAEFGGKTYGCRHFWRIYRKPA